MDGVQYVQTTNLPAGIISGQNGNDYYVENTTATAIYGPDRFAWESQTPVTDIQFYTTSDFSINGIRIWVMPLFALIPMAME